MATIEKWNPFGVSLNITATAGTVKRISATQYTVVLNVSWKCYWSGAKTNYGMTASAGGSSATINQFGTQSASGSGSFTGKFSISGNASASKTISVTFKNFNNDNGDSATKSISLTVSVPAWTSYTVKFNANGGSGAPSSQTKWKGQTLKLSTTKPTRTGYTFQGWGTSTSDTSVNYAAGANYTSDAAITLYAIWKANTYTVKFNANGGTGAPGNQTKTYGNTLTLSSVEPTRANYTFKGWGTSAAATTVAYAAGGSYKANAAITLYAVWELSYVLPRITGFSVKRFNADGTSALVTFNWATDLDVTSVLIEWKLASVIDYTDTAAIKAKGKAGTVTQIIGDGEFSTGATYTIRATVADSNGEYSKSGTLNSLAFTIHGRPGGNGVAFGKMSELEGVADFAYETLFRGGIRHPMLEAGTDLNDIRTPNTYVGANLSDYPCVNCPIMSVTFTLEVTGSVTEGRIKQRLQTCNKTESKAYERFYYSSGWGEWICVSDLSGTLLWEGAFFMHDGQTINLAEAVSKQRAGIVLVFSRYSSSTAQNYHFSCHFVPKMVVNKHEGSGHCFQMGAVNGDYFTSKYLYLSDTTIKGNEYNDDTFTDASSGITYTNNATVLRYVIGV